MTIVPIILSGGSGTRLWPLSRSLYPKQLLALTEPHITMMQQTVGRIATKAYSAPIIIANDAHRFIIAEQLRGINCDNTRIILEPCARNTAPAVALGALAALEDDPEAVILVMPSDHIIANTGAFHDAVAKALVAVKNDDALATFGIVPTRAETGYGYIEGGAAMDSAPGCHKVSRFVEKPDVETAQSYLDVGTYYWNSGIFLFRARKFLDELSRFNPDMLTYSADAMKHAKSDLDFIRPDADQFAKCPADSIDYAVMEKTSDAIVVPVDMAWSDVGSWSALWDVSAKDGSGNVIQGDVLVHNVKNSLLRSEGPAIAGVGLDNIIVVATPDAVLIADQDTTQDVKAIITQLERDGRDEHIAHVTVYRPWGSYQTTDRGERFQTKRLIVNPGEKLSLQKHSHRAEHWIVVQGTARVTRGDEVVTLYENQSTYIPVGMPHRLENPGKIPLHLIEVQSGSYLGEDDIERFEDNYGRT